MNHLVPIPVIAAKLELKIINSGGKYKSSYMNAEENYQKKAETGRNLTLEGQQLCWVRFMFIRLFVREYFQLTGHQVAKTEASSHGFTGLKSQMTRFESTWKWEGNPINKGATEERALKSAHELLSSLWLTL